LEELAFTGGQRVLAFIALRAICAFDAGSSTEPAPDSIVDADVLLACSADTIGVVGARAAEHSDARDTDIDEV